MPVENTTGGGTPIVPTLYIADLGHWRWALIATFAWWMLLMAGVWIRTAMRPPVVTT